MSDIHARADQLRAAGRIPIPSIGHAIASADRATDITIQLGRQPNTGRYLYMVDLDSHKPGQDADRARNDFTHADPALDAKLEWKESPNRGQHGFFESYKKLSSGPLYDPDGRHVGELLGSDTDRTLDPGDLAPPILNLSEIERLLDFWTVHSAESDGDRWSARAKEGQKWAFGWKRARVTRMQLRAALETFGNIGTYLAGKLDTAEVGERSDLTGNLMQCLMFNAHKLAGWNASTETKCRVVMAYWMAGGSFGKAREKGYSQEKDGYALIAKVLHEDTIFSGGRWTCPFWAKAQPTPPPVEPEPEPPRRPAHRPVGDQEKHIAVFRKVLSAIEPDEWGRRTYTLGYLADKMAARRVHAAPRTIQHYLKLLRDRGEIATAQIGGNGKPYAILKSCFGGAINSQKRVETPPIVSDPGGANVIAPECIETPQNDVLSVQCNKVEDHQDPGAPTLDEWAAADAWLASPAGQRMFAKVAGMRVDPAIWARTRAVLDAEPSGVLRLTTCNGEARVDSDDPVLPPLPEPWHYLHTGSVAFVRAYIPGADMRTKLYKIGDLALMLGEIRARSPAPAGAQSFGAPPPWSDEPLARSAGGEP